MLLLYFKQRFFYVTTSLSSFLLGLKFLWQISGYGSCRNLFSFVPLELLDDTRKANVASATPHHRKIKQEFYQKKSEDFTITLCNKI